MTDDITYREKGRAVFLAALMVLSVVAMTASFAGAAAAANADNYDEGPTFTGDISGNVWIGQEITLQHSNNNFDGVFISIAEGPESGDNPTTVTTREVDGDSVTFETDDLEDDEIYHIHAHGSGDASSASDFDFHGDAFRALSEDLNTEFESNTVTADGTATLEVESERDGAGQHLNVTSPDFDAGDLENLFGSEHAHPADTDEAILLQDVNDGQTFDVNFENVDADAGEYEFNFDVADSNGQDNATIEVTDEDEDIEFVNVDKISEGEIANVTLGVEHSETATVVLGDSDDGYVNAVDLSEIEDDEVVLQFNPHNADDETEDHGWSVHEDSNATIDETYADSQLNGEPLPAHNWDLSVGDELANADPVNDGFDLNNEFDRDILVITERAAIGDASINTAPKADNVNNFEDFEDTTVTETNTIANEDHLLLVVEDFGAEGAVEAGYDNVEIGIEQQDAGPIGDAASWNTSADDGDATDISGEVELINRDDYNGDLIYRIDYESFNAHDGTDFSSDEDYDVTVTFPEDDYVDEQVQQDLELSVEDRDVEWDAISALPAAEDATATGTTNVAPGTELDASADSPNDQGGFVEFTDAVVTEGDDGNHEFAAEFDLSNEEPGVLFDLTVDDVTGDSDATDTVEDVELIAADEKVPATFDVSADAPSSVKVGDDATLDVTIENTGDEAGTSNYSVVIDGEEVDSDELELEAGDSVDKSYELPTDADGDVEWSVTTDDDEASDTLTVEAEGDEGQKDNGDEDNGDEDNGVSDENGNEENGDESEDGTPGFGIAVALFALIAAAMLALRQQN